MSLHANNEYIVCSNNSMNENKHNFAKYNSEKKSRGLRALLRPIMKMIKRTSKRATRRRDASVEREQNDSNESLERKLVAEMRQCGTGAAVLVYGLDGACAALPVAADEPFVPVHFARTAAGTFFWTSASRAEADLAAPAHCYTECQRAEQQSPHLADRWVQA